MAAFATLKPKFPWPIFFTLNQAGIAHAAIRILGPARRCFLICVYQTTSIVINETRICRISYRFNCSQNREDEWAFKGKYYHYGEAVNTCGWFKWVLQDLYLELPLELCCEGKVHSRPWLRKRHLTNLRGTPFSAPVPAGFCKACVHPQI